MNVTPRQVKLLWPQKKRKIGDTTPIPNEIAKTPTPTPPSAIVGDNCHPIDGKEPVETETKKIVVSFHDMYGGGGGMTLDGHDDCLDNEGGAKKDEKSEKSNVVLSSLDMMKLFNDGENSINEASKSSCHTQSGEQAPLSPKSCSSSSSSTFVTATASNNASHERKKSGNGISESLSDGGGILSNDGKDGDEERMRNESSLAQIYEEENCSSLKRYIDQRDSAWEEQQRLLGQRKKETSFSSCSSSSSSSSSSSITSGSQSSI
jgi:hypothetical protein